jgi:hypothetical protein
MMMMKIPASEIDDRYDPSRRAAQSRVVQLEAYLADLLAASWALVFAVTTYNSAWSYDHLKDDLLALNEVIQRAPERVEKSTKLEGQSPPAGAK